MTTLTKSVLMNPSDKTDDIVDSLKGTSRGDQLKIIQNLIRNLQGLATKLDETRPDIANAIDQMIAGNSINISNMENRILHTIYANNLFTLDTTDGSISRCPLGETKYIMDVEPSNSLACRKSTKSK